LAYFVAALGEMKHMQPMNSPAGALAKAGEFIGCSEMSPEQQK
jgi:hypothetical protein